MKSLIIILLFGILQSCSAPMEALDATRHMPNQMDKMLTGMDQTNNKIETTNQAVHQQILMLAKEEMLNEHNSQYLLPPIGMMPGGKAFAEEATPEELMQITYAWLKEIDQVQAGEGNTMTSDEVDRDKAVKLTALQIIAGFTPQSVVKQIVGTYIYSKGLYEHTAKAFLALRAYFIQAYRLENGPLTDEGTNLNMVAEAIERTKFIQYITSLPFRDEIRVEINGFDDDVTYETWARTFSLEKDLATNLWNAILFLFEEDGVQVDSESKRFKKLKKEVESYLEL